MSGEKIVLENEATASSPLLEATTTPPLPSDEQTVLDDGPINPFPLHYEMILRILDHLPYDDWSRLGRTCRFFSTVVKPVLEIYKEIHVLDDRLIRHPIFRKHKIPIEKLKVILQEAEVALNLYFGKFSEHSLWKFAAICGMKELVAELLGDKQKSVQDEFKLGPLHYYIIGGHTDLMLEFIAENYPNFSALNDPTYGLPKMAIYAGRIDILEILFSKFHYSAEHYQPLNNETLLHNGVISTKLECITWLVNKGANLFEGKNLVDYCDHYLKGKHSDIRGYLVEQGVQPNEAPSINIVNI